MRGEGACHCGRLRLVDANFNAASRIATIWQGNLKGCPPFTKEREEVSKGGTLAPYLSSDAKVEGCGNGRCESGLADVPLVFTNLPAVQQEMIQNHTGHHGFGHRYGTNANARIMAALCDDLSRGAVFADRGARCQDG